MGVMRPVLVLLALVVLVELSRGFAQGDLVRFAVIGDHGYAGDPAAAVADLVRSWAPDFIVTTGDNNYPLGAAATIDANIGQYYHAFIHPYRGTYGPGATVNRFFPTLGNHDWDTAGARPYLDYFTLPGNERYYDVRWGPVHLFALSIDSREPDGHTADSAQAAWLRAALAASSAPWRIVALHRPPYSSGPHGPSPGAQWPFSDWGAHAVLAGHDHIYERVTRGDFPYFVNGLGGAARYALSTTPVAGSQVRFSAEHGAMLVEADDTRIAFRAFTRSGVAIDTYTLYTAPSSHPPAAPAGLTAQAVSGSEVDLAWVDNASNESEVVVEVSREGAPFAPLLTVPPNVNAHGVTGLDAQTAYAFRVSARNPAGVSEASEPAEATTMTGGAPPAPAALTARAASATAIDLDWTDRADNERGVVVEQWTGATWAPLAVLDRDTTALSVSGLAGGVTYRFRARAHNGDGVSPWSNEAASMTARPDMRVSALSGVPGAARPGDAMKLTEATVNEGNVAAPVSSTTRFYLAPDGGGLRVLLGGSAGVSPLLPGTTASWTGSVTIPKSVAPGRYTVQACADDKQAMVEHDEADNCLASPIVQLGRPDLVGVSVDATPTRLRRGASLAVTDTVRNGGMVPAARSTTRYYLSASGQPGSGAVRLKGYRGVPALEPGQTWAGGSRTATVPSSTVPGSYRLLACADDARNVAEEDEANNCAVTPFAVTVDP